MKRNLVLLSLVVGMGVQALDWYGMRASAAGRQVKTQTVAIGEGAWPMPHSR
jgi:hypothetical protein